MYKCGIGKFRPSWLQEFCTITWFTVFASILTFLQGVYFGYLLGILTTIEKRFEIRSQYSGALLSCWDAGYCVTILIIGHFASRINKPRWIAMGVTLIALCNFGLALPNFVFGPLSPNNRAVHSDLNSVKSGLCGANESETTSNQLNMANTNDYAYWMIAFFQIVIGIASAPAVTLVFVYVDDNCSKKRSPFLISKSCHSVSSISPINLI